MTSAEKLMPYFEAYSEKVRQRRNELGWTVTELAERSGVPYSNVSRVNAGTQLNPLLFNEAAIADCMGLSLDHLCGLITPADDESSLRKEIQALQLDNAKKDTEIQRLTGAFNTANAKAERSRTMDTMYTMHFIFTPILVIALIVYLIFDFQVKDYGLIRFGDLSLLAWLLIFLLATSSVLSTVIAIHIARRSKKSTPGGTKF